MTNRLAFCSTQVLTVCWQDTDCCVNTPSTDCKSTYTHTSVTSQLHVSFDPFQQTALINLRVHNNDKRLHFVATFFTKSNCNIAWFFRCQVLDCYWLLFPQCGSYVYICLLISLSVLYAMIAITCVCQCDSIRKLDDDDDDGVIFTSYYVHPVSSWSSAVYYTCACSLMPRLYSLSSVCHLSTLHFDILICLIKSSTNNNKQEGQDSLYKPIVPPKWHPFRISLSNFSFLTHTLSFVENYCLR